MLIMRLKILIVIPRESRDYEVKYRYIMFLIIDHIDFFERNISKYKFFPPLPLDIVRGFFLSKSFKKEIYCIVKIKLRGIVREILLVPTFDVYSLICLYELFFLFFQICKE